jgi:hypothetical protein
MARDGGDAVPRILRGGEVQRQSFATKAIRPNARRLIAQTWQSQANRSLFLVLLVIFDIDPVRDKR